MTEKGLCTDSQKLVNKDDSLWRVSTILVSYLLTTTVLVMFVHSLGVDQSVAGVLGTMIAGIIMSVIIYQQIPNDLSKNNSRNEGKTSWKTYIIVVLMMASSVFGIQVITKIIVRHSGAIAEELSENRMETFSNSPLLLILLLAFIFAPITEEFIFRYGVYGTMRNSFSTPVSAIASAVLFASIHLTLEAMFYGTVLGIIFALVYEYTGDIKVPILAHITYNVSVVLVPRNIIDTVPLLGLTFLVVISVLSIILGVARVRDITNYQNG